MSGNEAPAPRGGGAGAGPSGLSAAAASFTPGSAATPASGPSSRRRRGASGANNSRRRGGGGGGGRTNVDQGPGGPSSAPASAAPAASSGGRANADPQEVRATLTYSIAIHQICFLTEQHTCCTASPTAGHQGWRRFPRVISRRNLMTRWKMGCAKVSVVELTEMKQSLGSHTPSVLYAANCRASAGTAIPRRSHHIPSAL